MTGSHKRVETAARSNFSQKFLRKFCRSVVQEHRCPSSTRLRRHAECDEFSRSACSLTPALIFAAAARPLRCDTAFLQPCLGVPFQGWTVNLSAQSTPRLLCLPRRIFASQFLHDNFFLLPSVCDLKETSGQKPHCMSLFAALLHSLST